MFTINLTNGNDTPNSKLYKTVDFAYKDIRKDNSGSIILNIEGGYQYLTLDKCENCNFTTSDRNTNYIKINKLILLSNVIFDINLVVELSPTINSSLIITENNFFITADAVLKINEIKYNANTSYPDIVIFDVKSGNCNVQCMTYAKVNRKFTLIKSNIGFSSTFPTVESQGGDLFYSDANSLIKLINKDSNQVTIKKSYDLGMFRNTPKYNDFSLVNTDGNVLCMGLNVTLELINNSSVLVNTNRNVFSTSMLFNMRNEKGSYHDELNQDDSLGLYNCTFKSENLVKLSNTARITKVGSGLENIMLMLNIPKVRSIEKNYILTDDDSKKFHIDDSTGNVKILIPSTVKLSEDDLFFRRTSSGSKNKVHIHVDKSHNNPNNTFVLDIQHPTLSIYKYDGCFYVK